MQSVELTAKTADEAKTLAANKLGVPADQIRVTVLEETKGLFGRSNVRVRAEVVTESAPAKAEAPAKAAPKKAAKEEEEAPKAKAPRRGKKESEAPVAVAEPEVAVAPAEDAKPKRGGRAKAEKSEPAAEPSGEEGASEVVATHEDAEKIVEIFEDLMEKAGLSIDVQIGELNGKYVSIAFDGKDAAHLVGKHGEVLNAMQYLLNIMVSRRLNNGVRATLDGNDYRGRREKTLTELATKIANEVKARGEEAVLDALPAFERRVVHKALQTIDGVTTYSEGEEPNRRVVIAPAD